ncbi:hypothetical protein [Paraburkholderia caribensis]|uniref:hypothetical protein n=1 Tax=Paraburkholderia caribensis TaxID=75105 RepID=UPI0034D30F60
MQVTDAHPARRDGSFYPRRPVQRLLSEVHDASKILSKEGIVFFSFSVPIVSKSGRRYPAAVVDVVGTRGGASVHIFTDANRRTPVKVTNLLRVEVRSADYDADPTPIVDYLLNAVLDDLANLRFSLGRRTTSWPAVRFDRPKKCRWVSWTNRSRRIAVRLPNYYPGNGGRRAAV